MRKLAVLVCVIAAACAEQDLERFDTQGPAAEFATPQTRCVFELLRTHPQQLFGHQDTLAYGVNWFDEPGRSDVFETVGDYPSILGWDLGQIEFGRRNNLDGVDFRFMQSQIASHFNEGSISTVSWHVANPITFGQSWDRRQIPSIDELTRTGDIAERFELWLSRVIAFMHSVAPTPVLFRPFHEMNGDWFWWGDLPAEDFVELWRLTFETLEAASVNNVLWVYAPNSASLSEIEAYFPGDEYVDVIAIDDYANVDSENIDNFVRQLRAVATFANDGNKIAALAETGLEGLPRDDWFTQVLGPALRAVPDIRYAMVWRNANASRDRPNHFFAPYPDHASSEDFRTFAQGLDFASTFRPSLQTCIDK